MDFRERENKRRQSVVKSMISPESVAVSKEKEYEINTSQDIECKTKRLELIIRPSIHKACRDKIEEINQENLRIAKEERRTKKPKKLSLNDCVDQLLEAWVKSFD